MAHSPLKYQQSNSSPAHSMTPNDEMTMSRSEIQHRLRDNQSPPTSNSGLRKISTGGTQSPALNNSTYPLNELKIAVLGYQGVGKTAFIVRFLTRRFIGQYCHGIGSRFLIIARHCKGFLFPEAKYKCSLSIDGEIINLQLLDSSMPSTVSSDRDIQSGSLNVYTRVNEQIVEWADAFILVYSVTSHRSFQIARVCSS